MDDGKALNKAELQKLLVSPEWGAFHVAEITDDVADYGVVVGGCEEAKFDALTDAQTKYLAASGETDADIERLTELAAPIMREVDGGAAEVIDTTKDYIPLELIAAIVDPKVEKWAFNANFERICLSAYIRKFYTEYFLNHYRPIATLPARYVFWHEFR